MLHATGQNYIERNKETNSYREKHMLSGQKRTDCVEKDGETKRKHANMKKGQRNFFDTSIACARYN